MAIKPKTPMLNILDREEFRKWLSGLADAGDVAGQTGGGEFDPIKRFVEEHIGWRGRTLRFDYVTDAGKRYRLPGWAIEFQAQIDKEPGEPEEDGVTQLISAERCLEIMEEIP